MMLAVRADEDDNLVDVGFGAGMLHPMPLRDGAIVNQAGWDHHLASTHPRSPFTGKLIVLRLAPGVSRSLVGDELTVEYADGRLERSAIAPERLDATLRELDVHLDAAELDALAAGYSSPSGTRRSEIELMQ